VLLIVETLSLMLREAEIFAGRTACIKTDGGAVIQQLIMLLFKRPTYLIYLSDSEQVLQLVSIITAVALHRVQTHAGHSIAFNMVLHFVTL